MGRGRAGHLRVSRGGKARHHPGPARRFPAEAHRPPGDRRAGGGSAERGARAEGAVDAGHRREAAAEGPGARHHRGARGGPAEGRAAIPGGVGRGAGDPGGGAADLRDAPRGDGGRDRPVSRRFRRRGEARPDPRHPADAARGEAAAAPRAGRRLRARGWGLRFARRAEARDPRGPRARRRVRGGRQGTRRLDRAAGGGESRRRAQALGRARAVGVRPSVRHPGGPHESVRPRVPAGGRGPGAARPGARLRCGARAAAGERSGARPAHPGAGRATRDAARAAVRITREGEAAPRRRAEHHRGEGVRVSPVAIHRGASVKTTSQIYPPYIIERSSRGERTYDIFSRLLMDRIVFLGTQINDEVSNIIIAQLLFLDADNPDRDIYLYVNSPGGLVSSGMAIYDTMQFLRAPVNTICMGMAASMGSFLLAAGRKGKRSALPHARIMMHQPSGGPEGTAADIEIQAREILYLRGKLNELYAKNTGKRFTAMEKDMDRDRFMSADKPKGYASTAHASTHQGELDA